MRITNRKGLGEPQPGKKKQKHRSSRYHIGTIRLPPVFISYAVIGGFIAMVIGIYGLASDTKGFSTPFIL